MKALSIRQPWAWAILNAGKRIENRDWRNCYYRGPLLIHAAKGCTRAEYAEASAWMVARGLATWEALHASLPLVPDINRADRGGIVGVCNVVGHIRPDGHVIDDVNRVDHIRLSADDRRWHVPGSHGLVLADVRPLPFVPFKGALGFFDVPDDLVPGARP